MAQIFQLILKPVIAPLLNNHNPYAAISNQQAIKINKTG